MKWLRENTTAYFPGVELNPKIGEVIYNYPVSIEWDKSPFTIWPLTDGVLNIKVYQNKSGSELNTTYYPTNNITFKYKRVTDVFWTSVTPSLPGFISSSAYVTSTISLYAGEPVSIACSTGLARRKVVSTGSGIGASSTTYYYPGNITTTCPTIIKGNLLSTINGESFYIAASGNTPGTWSPWTSNNYVLQELFKGWNTLIDAVDLVIPAFSSGRTPTVNLSGLFSGCSSLTQAPMVSNITGIYTGYYEGCTSLRVVETNFDSSTIYTLIDWLKGTENGQRTLYVPTGFDSEFNLNLPATGWTVKEKTYN